MPGAQTKLRIMDVAERLFAEHGYDGVSLRQIARAARVPLALVTYHCGSKESLFRALFVRRNGPVEAERLAMLAPCEAAARPRVADIVRAIVLPFLRLRAGPDPGGVAYARLIAQTVATPGALMQEIVAEVYDPIARRFIAALRRALPDRTPEEVAWFYHFAVGAMCIAMADTGRIDRLSGGRCRSEDHEQVAAHLVPFVVAGLKARAEQSKHRRRAHGQESRREKEDRQAQGAGP